MKKLTMVIALLIVVGVMQWPLASAHAHVISTEPTASPSPASKLGGTVRIIAISGNSVLWSCSGLYEWLRQVRRSRVVTLPAGCSIQRPSWRRLTP